MEMLVRKRILMRTLQVVVKTQFYNLFNAQPQAIFSQTAHQSNLSLPLPHVTPTLFMSAYFSRLSRTDLNHLVKPHRNGTF